MHYLIMLLGIVSIFLLLTTLADESQMRKSRAYKLLHTDFVSWNEKNPEIPAVSLRTTQVVIGRLPSNDICLKEIDPQKRISRVHCILWWAGTQFRIAPKHVTRLKGFKLVTSRPEVFVNGISAPLGMGLPVEYGDTITICGHRFKLVNTAPDNSRPFFSDVPSPKDPQPVTPRPDPTHPTENPNNFFDMLRSLFHEWRSRRTNHTDSPPHNRKPHSFKLPRPILFIAAVAVLLCIAVGMLTSMIRPPEPAESTIGQRKEDTAAILVCGTDKDGERTDTIMLCLISGEDKRISLLSIPRDLRTTNKNGRVVRINAIYGNKGAEGMEDLMDNVALFTGYRPDGYVVFNWDTVKGLVDGMGGVTVDLKHYIRIHPPEGGEIYIPEGTQTLTGDEVLATLRYRAGYVNADIGRISVQREVVMACLDQWVKPSRIPDLYTQAKYVLENSLTDLDLSNVLWLGTTFLENRDDFQLEEQVISTIPVYSGKSYKGERADTEKLLELLNKYFNPFTSEITAEHLTITP